jgi:hypothetical protein
MGFSWLPPTPRRDGSATRYHRPSAGSTPEWQFSWFFDRGELSVEPSLGRALIQDALLRFLVKSDYDLEPGGDYTFTVRARF